MTEHPPPGDPGDLELRGLAAEAADKVGRFLLREGELHNDGEAKSTASDMVTAADRAAEALAVESLSATRPDDGFTGEEGTNSASTTGVRWIIDPIDGTANFVFSHPGYAVSIAAERNGVVVAGAVADPVHGQLFDAGLGHGARCNGRPITARTSTELGRALVATGFSFDPDQRRAQAHALTVILPEIADIRRMGSAAIDLCAVAIGRVDAYYEAGLNEWDFAAGALIAAEAGAHVVLPPGAANGEAPLIIAAAPGIAADLIELLGRAGLPI